MLTHTASAPATENQPVEVIAYKLLGGQKTIPRRVCTSLDAHDLIIEGIPSSAMAYLVDHVGILSSGDFMDKAIGISLRTLQRRKADRKTSLSREQSSRAWRFAKILAKASYVLGSQEEAEKWMLEPAYGLDNRRPIDLLASSEGAEIVDEHLTRMEYGVYA
jgi:putative toxin-antitoxin system antitoxin component (TIGR02293 family)